jgi:beta-glucosidase
MITLYFAAFNNMYYLCGGITMNRRRVLESMLAVTSTAMFGRAFGAATLDQSLVSKMLSRPAKANTFPKDFIWGAATAAYQVEGAWNVDGRSESVWDRFSHTPGKIKNNDNGDVACDSYHRYKEDVALLKALNLKSYRFSIAWPRVLPTVGGKPNAKGLDYYKRLVDELLENGIRPMATLYHWDLPQEIEDRGGWPNRDTADYFVDYVDTVARALSDRIQHWCILNEPKTFLEGGYWQGYFAPGRREPLAFLRASHVANLAQGRAFVVLKSHNKKAQVSSAFDPAPVIPYTESELDQQAAVQVFKLRNLWNVWPALTGQYPEGVLPANQLHDLVGFKPGDEVIVRAPFDMVGLNYYTSTHVGGGAPGQSGIPGFIAAKQGWGEGPHAKTDIGWDVYPEGFYDIVYKMSSLMNHQTPIEITESGCAYNIGPDAQGRIRDTMRIDYLRSHLQQMAQVIKDGVPLRGYHAWSLLDNFEWAQGFTQRFGLVYVDYANKQKRIIKDSGHWYAKVAATNRVG